MYVRERKHHFQGKGTAMTVAAGGHGCQRNETSLPGGGDSYDSGSRRTWVSEKANIIARGRGQQ